ncbi:SDR family oxidoreductase [Bradyrhizobium cajani]|uniref:NAD(P)H-binding protein n=1 Tax=Bradyrhizobium cajani TaxID=1928661 RepID=A0A844T551_9BRAD|nr:NAD(P)H-binding protein [Bradyrhizobium cajani]MCP3370963.1 epimerase [Bradyrhizobium cajani]MVT71549.1 NAD(P)H-binding protein [Bradyrhizobium cajani]
MSSADAKRCLVIGATGLVGGHILQLLLRSGQRPLALSRSRMSAANIDWFCGDLAKPETLNFPAFTTLYCTADAILLADALPAIVNPSLKRIVVFSSTSVMTKRDSEIAGERELLGRLAEAEDKIVRACTRSDIEWTILRPTLIYEPGRDTNITPLSRLIRRYGFMPLVGGGSGLRQPVHAEDLAIGAIAAASSSSAANKFYSLPGGETLTYREMIGRIFEGMGLPRRTIPIPVVIWRAGFVFAKPLFPGANVAMGTRMTRDMIFDSTPASRDFGWNPRSFRPSFDQSVKTPS